MTTTLLLNLMGIFVTDHSPEKSTNPVGDFFTQAFTAVNDFFQYIIGLFNQEFPPESRDEQIHRWLKVGTPYLIVAAVLIVYFGRNCCCGGKSMKAPGRSQKRISRRAFEENPKGYFRDLHGKSN